VETNASPSLLQQWIASALTSERLDAQSLLITLFGDSIAPFGGHAWLKSLITLAEPFGLNERLVRTSVFRLAAEGWLTANRQGRRSEYRLTQQGFSRFEHAHRRIYLPGKPDWDGRWTFVVQPSGEAAPARAQLKRELEWEGFVPLGTGMLAHPSARLEAVGGIIDRLQLREQVFVLTGGEAVPLRGRTLRDFAKDAWSLETLAQDYAQFLQRFEPLHQALQQADSLPPAAAFIARTLLIHFLRRVQLRDPQLPEALLPTDWPGDRAYAVSASIYALLYERANEHVRLALEVESGFVPPLTPYFYQRFGGLLNTLT
jgi:phenylacetic acid degradation operon negative regulatory protein